MYINRTPGIASGAAITIRGVASLESDKSYEPSIGVVMDGMFLGTSSGVLLDNFDIERIEVLRGPQGTLFGKNTTGGILNIIRIYYTSNWKKCLAHISYFVYIRTRDSRERGCHSFKLL